MSIKININRLAKVKFNSVEVIESEIEVIESEIEVIESEIEIEVIESEIEVEEIIELDSGTDLVNNYYSPKHEAFSTRW